MSRSERLLELLHLLRQHRLPVSGHALAQEAGVSIRTLYRDIASLQAQGADIRGEPGVGYVLKPGYMLPPLMFPLAEVEALVLGMRWVAERADGSMADSARSALARVAAILPQELRDELETSAFLIGPGPGIPDDAIDPAFLRAAIREEQKLRIEYRDAHGQFSSRVIWPFALAFFDNARVLIGWCEERDDFRSFRTDRIGEAERIGARYPKRRQALMKAWSATLGK